MLTNKKFFSHQECFLVTLNCLESFRHNSNDHVQKDKHRDYSSDKEEHPEEDVIDCFVISHFKVSKCKTVGVDKTTFPVTIFGMNHNIEADCQSKDH